MPTRLSTPLFTASFYAQNRLDEAITQVVAPFWRELSYSGHKRAYRLWFLRYSTDGGEHLKIRVYGPPEGSELARRLLVENARTFCLGRALPLKEQSGKSSTPHLDEEDRIGTHRPDGTLEWTHAKRSPFIFGGDPPLFDDQYLALLTACLGHGCDIVLEAFERGRNQPLSHQRRQTTLLKLLAAWLSSRSCPIDAKAYIAYHRDWLIRSRILAQGGGPSGVGKILEYFDHKIEKVEDSSRSALRRALSCTIEIETDKSITAWQQSLHVLTSHLEDSKRSSYNPDPFTDGPLFPVAFKLLNLLANQLGIKAMDEALAYHLALRCIDNEYKRRPVILVPDQEHLFDASHYEGDTLPDEQKFDFEKHYDWAALIACSGSAGRDWVQQYGEISRHVQPVIQEAVAHLREGEIGPGYRLLQDAHSRWRSLRANHRTFFHVLGRFYYAGLAYYHYTLRDFNSAETAIRETYKSIRCAARLDKKLLPFAVLCIDVPLKMAQIARARHRWTEMRNHLREAQSLVLDDRPLCTFGSGRSLSHTAIGSYLRTFPSTIEQHELAIRYLLNKGMRQKVFERLVAKLYLLPGFPIPYP